MKDATYISVLLDRSGSMEAVKDDTIGGFNAFVDEQKKEGDNCRLSLVQFDTGGVDTIYENKAVKDVPHLDATTYTPRGGTPLLDALGDAIASTGKVLSAIPEDSRPDKVVFVVITDGQENSSRRFTKQQVKEAIEHQTQAYKWLFVYLGANQDAFAEAHGIGIPQAMAANYANTNTATAFAATSANVRQLRATGQRAAMRYSGPQRSAMLERKPKLLVTPIGVLWAGTPWDFYRS